jgi:hypothetical protein
LPALEKNTSSPSESPASPDTAAPFKTAASAPGKNSERSDEMVAPSGTLRFKPFIFNDMDIVWIATIPFSPQTSCQPRLPRYIARPERHFQARELFRPTRLELSVRGIIFHVAKREQDRILSRSARAGSVRRRRAASFQEDLATRIWIYLGD